MNLQLIIKHSIHFGIILTDILIYEHMSLLSLKLAIYQDDVTLSSSFIFGIN